MRTDLGMNKNEESNNTGTIVKAQKHATYCSESFIFPKYPRYKRAETKFSLS